MFGNVGRYNEQELTAGVDRYTRRGGRYGCRPAWKFCLLCFSMNEKSFVVSVCVGVGLCSHLCEVGVGGGGGGRHFPPTSRVMV
jgi:hypothetical protein